MGILRRIFGGGSSEEEDLLGDPSFSQAIKLTSQGNYFGERGDLARAIACFQGALAFKRDHVPAHLALSVAYREMGEYQQALDVLAAAPSVAGYPGGQTNFAFEIAHHKAVTLLARQRERGFDGDLTELIAAYEHAREVGRLPVEPDPFMQASARALGINVDEDRRQALAMIDTFLAGIKTHTKT